jgi:ribose 5-phosphate isomerase A
MNWIVDTQFAPIDDPAKLHDEARRIPGIVDTGLFIKMADVVLVGGDDAVIEMR